MAFAATELDRYLERILGVKGPKTPEGGDGQRIHLSVKRDAGLTDEGYELRAQGSVYHIIGGGQSGVVFGAYDFLRRYGGCRFSDLGPDGEFVPRRQRIEAEAGPVRMTPKLWYRGLQFYYSEDAELCRQRIDWMAKNGLNYVMYTPAQKDVDPNTMVDPRTGGIVARVSRDVGYSKEWFDKELLGAIRKRGLKLDMNHHNLLYWLPPNRHLAEHPEWYAEVDGERGQHFTQL